MSNMSYTKRYGKEDSSKKSTKVYYIDFSDLILKPQ